MSARKRPGEPGLVVDPTHLPLILVGLPGAGKTTVARLLAAALGVQVTDTDAEVRRRARMTIPQIFASEGEECFRDREQRALRAVLESEARAQGVVALGGGAVLRAENRAMLAGHSVIHLVASPATAAAHVGDGSGRPLMNQTVDSDAAEAALDGPVAPGILARMEALHAERAPLYEEVATITVATDGLTPEQVSALVLVALGASPSDTARSLAAAGATRSSLAAPSPRRPDRPRTVASSGTVAERHGPARVRVGGARPYEVVIGHDLAPEVTRAVQTAPGGGAGGVAIVHPQALTRVARGYEADLAGAGGRVTRVVVPDGEACKCAAVLTDVWEALGAFRMGRDGCLIGLGGGATTDLAGFAAASWLRGVPVVQVPTSLLAMVDAAVGGKTGIDTAAGKNLVGAFHPPSAVIADLAALATLPTAELRAGMAEVVKCGFIADPVILDRVLADPANCLNWDSPVLADLVTRSVAVKAAVVSEDLTESGLREILNYGHTYAHAIEKVTNYTWRHGEAVAVGCVFAAETAWRTGRLGADELALHRRALEAVGLPTTFPEGADHWADLHAAMLSDKKVRAGTLRMVLLEAIAAPVRARAPEAQVLKAAHTAVTAPGRTHER